MALLYGQDLAYIQSAAFGGLARAAAPEIVRLLKNATTPIHRVVDVGCGAGVLTSALVKAGFDVTGVDYSADRLAIAAARVPGARFVNASIYDYAIPGCEAIVAIGEPLTYHDEIADADRRVHNFLQRSATTLPPGGILVFDVIEAGEPSLAGRFWTSGTDWAMLAETTEYQASRTRVRMIETFRQVGHLYRRRQELHRIRLFDTNELLAQLARCGFAAETLQAYAGEPLLPRRRAFICNRS
jgi:SAM-dependent methyltransferase